MSEEQLWSNARRWHRQAANDREAAEALVAAEKYAQASFLAQSKTTSSLRSQHFTPSVAGGGLFRFEGVGGAFNMAPST